MDKSGPNTVPCGTPQVTSRHMNSAPQYDTNCDLLDTLYTIMVKFIQKNLMIYSVESLLQVQEYRHVSKFNLNTGHPLRET